MAEPAPGAGAAGERDLDLSFLPQETTTVVLNVTVTEPTSDTYVTLFPSGGTTPATSNLNVPAAGTVANLVVVPVGTGGKVRLHNAVGTAHVVADIVGFYRPGLGELYYALPGPARLLDSRTPGPAGGAWGPTEARVISLPPPTVPPGATAVVARLTATDGTAGTYLTLYPNPATRPLASALSPRPGQTSSNLVVTPVVLGGTVAYNAAGSVHLVLDVAGWFGPG